MVAAVLADSAFSRQLKKMRNLTDNLSEMSNKTYSEAVIGQFKTQSLKKVYSWSDHILTHLVMPRGPWPCLSGPWDLI